LCKLKPLSNKADNNKNKLKKEQNKKVQKELKKQLAIVHAQRKKGIEALKKLKKSK